ncbi:hypothetical protein OX283_013315 [Flavobacterium sp. SUN052]|uniref:hypothetical protein n=1 Tax=Flavobacterium sp. SUN052 TaxID=3002441 RepID=UPI00237EAED1|nr:hypothetical protein [Flavobacterium sp. SUN052]MEC4005643.1 hypothetical protein [Flavobacterium sp. SUN052]
MNTLKVQNDIIRKVLDLKDEKLLDYIDNLLNTNDEKNYILSNEEQSLLAESKADYEKGNIVSNDEVFSKIDKWLEK